jgi:AcrR family transcriptional regulator
VYEHQAPVADGYGAVTIERVAAPSGVAKSTIYRWWTSKADLVMEAYQQLITRTNAATGHRQPHR